MRAIALKYVGEKIAVAIVARAHPWIAMQVVDQSHSKTVSVS
jgi:type III secretion system FlhB-like substrate exporter